MSLGAAAWCIVCGAAPTVAVTVERRGVLMHYGSCWAHLAAAAARAQADTARIDDVDAEVARRTAELLELERRFVHGTDADRAAVAEELKRLGDADPVVELDP
jgi:hypothetical protein